MTVSPIARQSSDLTASIAEQKLVGQPCIQQILSSTSKGIDPEMLRNNTRNELLQKNKL